MTEVLKLTGCTPEPLMNYLKTLGVFRLVAEQADPEAALSWTNGVATLHSRLDRDGLIEFFVNSYQPTPVMTPWNSASGFAPTKATNKAPKDKAAREAVNKLADPANPRLAKYATAIRSLNEISRGDEDAKTWKWEFLARCRANLPDEVLPWLDTCLLLGENNVFPFPLLGSGGNDGVTDFSSLFMQRLCDVVLPDDVALAQGWLESAIFADSLSPLKESTVGQFSPGRTGGANAAQGRFEASSLVNPWDFVLMIEGALLMAGAVSRRMGVSTAVGQASFPFFVDGIAEGSGSFSPKDARDSGKEPPNAGELWLPIWSSSIGFDELKYLFAEGRVQFGRRQARNTVEFAVAANTLGINTGIDSFCRVGFLRRNGKQFLAAPLARVDVMANPKARLLEDANLIRWTDRLRNECRESDGRRDKVPARYKTILRQIDRAMLEFAVRSDRSSDAKSLIAVMRSIGVAERTLATSGLTFCIDRKRKSIKISPIQNLNPDWIEQANDDSAEFRIAAALAGISGVKNVVGPLRVFMEEVEVKGIWASWSPGSCSAVWSRRSLAANLASVFQRRQLEAFQRGSEEKGVPLSSTRPAALSDVIAFLNAETDDDKIDDLLWALIGINWSSDELSFRLPDAERYDGAVPVEFGLARLLVKPLPLAMKDGRWRIVDEAEPTTPDPAVFYELASGRVDAVSNSVTRAARRHKSDGRIVTGYRTRLRSGRELTVLSPIDPERLLAAMLIPLSNNDLSLIANSVLSFPETEE